MPSHGSIASASGHYIALGALHAEALELPGWAAHGEPGTSRNGPPQTIELELDALGLVPGALTSGDERLLRLLASHDLVVDVFRPSGSPIWYALTKRAFSNGDDTQADSVTFAGTGSTAADAIRRCLGEFAEFCSWLYRPADLHRVCLSSDLEAHAIDPVDLHGFASDQIAQRDALNAAWEGYDAVPPPWAADEKHAWCRVSGLGQALPSFAPLFLCYGRAQAAEGHDPAAMSNSNGAAAGVDLPSAQLAALLEVIERDAVGIWWYAACSRPALELNSAASPGLAAALEWRRSHRRRFWLLDLTHDLAVPVVAALSTEPNGRLLAFGSAARTSHAEAAEAAFLEMCQSELELALLRCRCSAVGEGEIAPSDQRKLEWLSKATPGRLPFLLPTDLPTVCSTTAGPDPALSWLEHCISCLAQKGLQAYSLDLTRSEIGVSAAKVLVPGLCHSKPRLGFRRLVEVPVQLGWRRTPFSPTDLQRLPLLM